MKLLLAPHNDDESLFAAFTCIREKPLVAVITDSWVQWNRGDGITADQRWDETCEAMDVLGCDRTRVGLRDDELTQDVIECVLRRLGSLYGDDLETVYVPDLQGGHPHHDFVCRAAIRTFHASKIVRYCTYSEASQSYANTGARRIDGSTQEKQLKRLALSRYVSQFARSRHHFQAVMDQPEWLTP